MAVEAQRGGDLLSLGEDETAEPCVSASGVFSAPLRSRLRCRSAKWQPARHRGPVGAVILTEAPLKPGFFKIREIEIDEYGEQQSVDAQARRVEPQGLSKSHREQAECHRVLEARVWPGYHQPFGWIKGQRRPVSTEDQVIRARKQQQRPSHKQHPPAVGQECPHVLADDCVDPQSLPGEVT